MAQSAVDLGTKDDAEVKDQKPEAAPAKDADADGPIEPDHPGSPPVDQAVKLEPGKKKYKVKLKDNPEVEVSADSAADAWERYRIHCGIIKTPHTPTVSEVR